MEEKPAEVQITAEKLLSDAYKSQSSALATPKYQIEDSEELREYQGRKRTEYEGYLRRNRFNFGQWMRYAQFEIEQHDLARARSVFERALEVDPTNVPLWVRYVQTEIKGKNVNHARNLLERAVSLLPRVDKLWYLYLTTEESLGSVIAARNVYKRWVQWMPSPEVWKHYAEFEERYGEVDNARDVFEKYATAAYATVPKVWQQWAEFEQRNGDDVNVRNVYKLAVNKLYASGDLNSAILESWIRFETEKARLDKVKELYNFGDKALKGAGRVKLQNSYTRLQKRYGTTADIEGSVLSKRQGRYESELASNPRDYETWWLYLDLLSDPLVKKAPEEIRMNFEKSLQPPTSSAKSDWLPWLYLGLRYANWEEVHGLKQPESVRKIYTQLLGAVPHKQFTFARLWVAAAEFEIRQDDLSAARKLLGRSLGMCPNEAVIEYYIDLECRLKEFDRARKIYNKLLEVYPENYQNWISYINFEDELGDTPRAHALGELATDSDFLSAHDQKKLYRYLIGQAMDSYDFAYARQLFDRYAANFATTKVYTRRALFELEVPSAEQIKELDPDHEFDFDVSDDAKERVRQQFEKFIESSHDDDEQKAGLLEALQAFEEKYGDTTTQQSVADRQPTVTKEYRDLPNGTQQEYFKYVFPAPSSSSSSSSSSSPSPSPESDPAEEAAAFTKSFASRFEE